MSSFRSELEERFPYLFKWPWEKEPDTAIEYLTERLLKAVREKQRMAEELQRAQSEVRCLKSRLGIFD